MPIYKNGNKEESFNYRPVSLTSIVCKICEKVIKKQWTNYLEREAELKVSRYAAVRCTGKRYTAGMKMWKSVIIVT